MSETVQVIIVISLIFIAIQTFEIARFTQRILKLLYVVVGQEKVIESIRYGKE